ncbi:MAG: hypothetical protein R2939_03170 [Kofleriaceae bacterium]
MPIVLTAVGPVVVARRARAGEPLDDADLGVVRRPLPRVLLRS